MGTAINLKTQYEKGWSVLGLPVSESTDQKFQSHRSMSARMQCTNIRSGKERNYTREATLKTCSDRGKYFFLFKVIFKYYMFFLSTYS